MSRREGARRFATILFTDIVGSTDIARELGDARWRELVRRHHAIVRRELKRFGGHEMDTAGDSFFAIFDSPGAGIRCGVAITEAVREVGLEVRAGLHAGEVEPSEGKAGGIAVNIGARVMAVAGFGEVLVSQTLRDVVAGSSLGFEDHGVHSLKGIEGEWRLFRVATVDGERVQEPLDGSEASRRRLAIEPARGVRSRRPAAIGGAIAAVVLAGVLVFALTRGDEDALHGPGVTLPSAGPPASSLVKLDPTTGQIEFARTDVPGRAFFDSNVVAGAGGVWMIRSPLVLEVDVTDGSTQLVKGLESSEVSVIGVGADEAYALGNFLWPIDPLQARAGDPIAYETRGNAFFTASDLTVAFDSVWITSTDHSVTRVDPSTGKSRIIDVGDTPERAAAGSRYLWVLDESAGSVWRLDPSNDHVLPAIPLTGGQDALAIGHGFVWVLDTGVGTLTPVEEATGETRPAIDVGDGATAVAAGGDAIWVADAGDVLEIDPASFSVTRTIHVGANPIGALTVDEDGAIWLDMARAG